MRLELEISSAYQVSIGVTIVQHNKDLSQNHIAAKV
jgi:hypothetical protein